MVSDRRGSDLGTLPICFLASELSQLIHSELHPVSYSELSQLHSELHPASYRLFEDNSPKTYEQELCPFVFLDSELSRFFQRVTGQRVSIDHGLFELGTTRDTLGTTPEGGVLLGPERPRTYDDLNDNEKKRFDADVRATNIVLQGLPKDIYKLINHNIEAKAI
ncbi:hypothetical protein Tco_1346931 [Tanacetum coccineum]